MKGNAETSRNSRIDDEELQIISVNLVLPFLNSDNVLLKCLAIETLGRIAQAVAEPQVSFFLILLIEFFINRIKLSLLLATLNIVLINYVLFATKSREQVMRYHWDVYIVMWDLLVQVNI